MLEGLVPSDFTITTLPGYTNRNFRLHNRGHDWVLRVPRPETNRFIDRAAEANNQALACGLGIAPRPAWHDSSGLSLTPTLGASRNLRRSDLLDPAILQAIVAPVRKLHRSGADFRGRVDLAELLTRYYSMLPLPLQAKYRERLQAARLLIPQLEDRDYEYVPSHNDLVLANLLLEADRVWLIDWEFSAMASPYWDLATLCNAGNLDYRQSLQLLHLYCGPDEQMEESLLFDYRNLLQLLGDCWMAALVD
ncbi:MAG: choline kinase family protein [Gammaproteobacteria bacterium]|nr:choline kinase family protein [Gammaproteobacteria bacterium]